VRWEMTIGSAQFDLTALSERTHGVLMHVLDFFRSLAASTDKVSSVAVARVRKVELTVQDMLLFETRAQFPNIQN
jgi:hypothetical protein